MVNLLYTPYGLKIEIVNIPEADSNSLNIELNAGKEYFQIIKDNFLNSYKRHNGLQKLQKKLKKYQLRNFSVREIDKAIFGIYIEVPVRSKSHRIIDTIYKVARIFAELLLKKFPRFIEGKSGLSNLLKLYDKLEVKMVLSGNSNIYKVFRLLRKMRSYIGFKY